MFCVKSASIISVLSYRRVQPHVLTLTFFAFFFLPFSFLFFFFSFFSFFLCYKVVRYYITMYSGHGTHRHNHHTPIVIPPCAIQGLWGHYDWYDLGFCQDPVTGDISCIYCTYGCNYPFPQPFVLAGVAAQCYSPYHTYQ